MKYLFCGHVLEVCSKRHGAMCFEGSSCPACEILRGLDVLERLLKREGTMGKPTIHDVDQMLRAMIRKTKNPKHRIVLYEVCDNLARMVEEGVRWSPNDPT